MADQKLSELTPATSPLLAADDFLIRRTTGNNRVSLTELALAIPVSNVGISLIDGSRAFTAPVAGVTPVIGVDLTTKDYVDSLVQGLVWQDPVIDRDLTTPPGSPTTGDRYIVATGGTGDWATHDDEITEWNGTAWTFVTLTEGLALRVLDEDLQIVYNGSAWVTFGATVTHANLSGLQGGTTAEYFHLTAAEHAALIDLAGPGEVTTPLGKFLVSTGAGTWAHQTQVQVRTTLALTIGVDVQAWGTGLDKVLAVGVGADKTMLQVVDAGGTLNYRTPSQIADNLGLGPTADAAFASCTISKEGDNEFTVINSLGSNANEARKTKIRFKGHKADDSAHTLGYIEVRHDGTSNDQKGEMLLHVNSGAEGDSPSERMKLDAFGNVFSTRYVGTSCDLGVTGLLTTTHITKATGGLTLEIGGVPKLTFNDNNGEFAYAIGIGVTPTANMTGLAIEQGGLTLKEITTPTADPDYAKIYPKIDNRLYFQDGAGVEHEIVEVNVEHGEFFVKGNATATVITTVNDPVALELGASSHLKDFTFVAGSNGVITDTANNSGTLRITDVAHGLLTGDIVTINGLATASQNGITAITRIDDDTFDCDDITFATIDETGTWQMGSYLLAPTGSASDYRIMFSSSATSAGANKTFTIEVMNLISTHDDAIVERKFSSTDIGSMSTGGLITIADADRIWVAITGITDATNLTLKHFNMSLNRV